MLAAGSRLWQQQQQLVVVICSLKCVAEGAAEVHAWYAGYQTCQCKQCCTLEAISPLQPGRGMALWCCTPPLPHASIVRLPMSLL
jgi:hypothetical protein